MFRWEKPKITPEEKKRDFNSLSREEQEIELERALYLLQIAEEAEIKITPRDVAIFLGYEDEKSISRISNLIKEKLPFVKGRKEKFEAVISHIHEKALFENEEFDESKRFSQWLEQFSPSELANAQLFSDRISDPMAETPILIIQKEDGTLATFELSKLLNFSEEQLAKLPENIKRDLEARREFWQKYGITSGPELKSFLERNFKKIEFKKDVIEFEWLKAVYPKDYEFLENLKKRGAEISLVVCQRSPEEVLKAIRYIAVESQHKFVSTWLPAMVRKGTEPVILKKDVEALKKEYSERLRTLQEIKIQSEFRRLLIEKLWGEELAQKTDFSESIEKIAGFIPFFMSIEVKGGDLSVEDIQRIREINQKFDKDIGNEYALRKLLFDDANNTSEHAQNIIKAMTIIGPTAHILEHFGNLPGLAKFLAASADDIMSEWAEILALLGAGVTWKEIKNRFKVLGPAFPVAFFLAGIVEPAREKLNERIAGTIFSLAAVFLSAVTCVLSVKMFAENYLKLAREGKIPEHPPTINKSAIEKIRKILETLTAPVTKEDIWKAIEETLRELGEDEESIQEKEKLFSKFAQSKTFEEIFEALKEPSILEKYLKGLKEAAGINPARFGIAVGALSAGIFGFLAGPVFLRKPLLYALAGSYESVAGVSSLIGYKMVFPLRWRCYVLKKIKEAKEKH